MKKKLIIFIISIIAVVSTYITTTYSKFTATSETELSLDFVVEPTYTYYFQRPPDWGTTTVYAYMWGEYEGNEVVNAAFPGIEMECIDSNMQIYSYTLSTELAYKTYGENVFENIIFSNGEKDSGLYMKKTVDLTVKGDINGKIYVPELYSESGTRVYCYGYDPCYIYMWNSDNDEKAAWPGTLLDTLISDKGYYTILDGNYQNFIFNRPVNTATQSQNLTIPNYQDLTCVITGDKASVWKRLYYSGSWHNYSDWEEEEYYDWLENDYQGFLEALSAGYN